MIAGNWKMYKTVAEAEEYIQALLPRVSGVSGVDIGICPSSCRPGDGRFHARLAGEVYAQNMHHAEEGAFTGEVLGPGC